MIPVVFPRSVNWFYEAQARSIAEDLAAAGVPACAVASDQPWVLATCDDAVALIVSFAESRFAAEKAGMAFHFTQALKGFRRRVLVNFDGVQSRWFNNHFSEGAGYFAEIFDVGLYRQTSEPAVSGVPYRFVPEAFSASEKAAIRPWDAGRAIPWTMLGHETRERSALIEAALRCLPRNGFVFSPPLRPFTQKSGLNRAAIDQVLRQTDLYVWGSHHRNPYHETQRALHAVSSGAIPVKIDPLHATRMNLPWVYPSLNAFLGRRDRLGLAGLYEEARAFLDSQGTIGGNIRAALKAIGLAASPELARAAQ